MSTENPLAELIALCGQLREALVPSLRRMETATHSPSMPREVKLQLIVATRSILTPLREAIQDLLEPLAATDTRLADVERALKRGLPYGRA